MVVESEASRICFELESSPLTGSDLRRAAMEKLAALDGYDWAGVYMLDGDKLHLAEYVGASTDHVLIPVGVGVCGTAVADNRNQLVDDVRSVGNYLACSTSTRSEIVVLIKRGGEVLGQIDIDGHKVGSFDASDEAMLECVAELLASRWD